MQLVFVLYYGWVIEREIISIVYRRMRRRRVNAIDGGGKMRGTSLQRQFAPNEREPTNLMQPNRPGFFPSNFVQAERTRGCYRVRREFVASSPVQHDVNRLHPLSLRRDRWKMRIYLSTSRGRTFENRFAYARLGNGYSVLSFSWHAVREFFSVLTLLSDF